MTIQKKNQKTKNMLTFTIFLISILAVVAENNYRLRNETPEQRLNRDIKRFMSNLKIASLYDLRFMSVEMHRILEMAKKVSPNYSEIETKLICAFNQRKYELTAKIAIA